MQMLNNHLLVEPFDKGDVKEMTITDDMQARIRELAASPNIRERFVASMAPSIYGMHHVAGRCFICVVLYVVNSLYLDR